MPADRTTIKRLIQKYETEQPTDKRGYEYAGKLDIIDELTEMDPDAWILAFFLAVVTDTREYDLARVEILKYLELFDCQEEDCEKIEQAILGILTNPNDHYLVRWWAGNALDGYIHLPGALDAVQEILLDPEEDHIVRHNILGAVRRLGPTDRVIATVRALLADAELGRYMPRLLNEWHVADGQTTVSESVSIDETSAPNPRPSKNGESQ